MILLSKNQTISLTKTTDNNLTSIVIGTGWDPVNKSKGFFGFGGGSIDLDASVILLDEEKNEVDAIYFGHKKSKCGSILHHGDNLTGEGDGDDEIIDINLESLPSNVKYIGITVNSFKGQTFDKVSNAYCRILDAKTNKELVKYSLSEQGNHTGIVIAYLEKVNYEWMFTATGYPCQGRIIRDLKSDIVSVIR